MKRTNTITTWTRRSAWIAVMILLGLLLSTCGLASTSSTTGTSPTTGNPPTTGNLLSKCPADSTITTITTEAGLKAINDNPSGKYCIGEHITLISNWEPLDTFTGTLDGNGKTISGLTIDKSTTDDVGFFDRLGGGASVKNLRFDDPTVKGQQYTGVLAGRSNGSTTVVESIRIVGGSITGTNYIGGLVGYNNGSTIQNSYAMNTVTGTGDATGGLVGFNSGTITNSYATGAVSGAGIYVGGLVGSNYDGTIQNSYATGTVMATSTGTGAAAGGLAGFNKGPITNSYARSTVAGANIAGGLVGHNISAITNSYATGAVSGAGIYVGGLVGSNYHTITHSYYDTMSTGQTVGMGRNTSQAANVIGVSAEANIEFISGEYYDAGTNPRIVIFVDWDFKDIWVFATGEWPTVAWQNP